MRSVITVLLLLVAFAGAIQSASGAEPQRKVGIQDSRSLQNEVQRAIDRGLDWLRTNQSSNGWWQTADHPGVTALVLTAFNGDPMDRYRGAKRPEGLKRGYAYLLSCVKEDGSICITNLPAYNTSIGMMALMTANDERFKPTIQGARNFLISVQHDFGEKGKLDSPYDGGFGYGLPSDKNSDLSNTHWVLEALYHSKRQVEDGPASEAKDLNWAAAVHFLESCQNLSSHNKQGWASDDPKEKGGFIYNTGRSNAGSETNSAGRVTWRSYGSISYAGMLSYLYADLRPDDPRVTAVAKWLGENYTLEENPGMGTAGLYFYYHTMSKALALASRRDLKLVQGKQANWREELALKLMDLQAKDGSWTNTNARWWEKEPALVTAYSVLALESIWRALEN